MPLLGVVGERRLIAATVEGAEANRLSRFPYLNSIEKMAIPDWPARTADISEIGVEVRFAPAGTLGKLLSGVTGNPARLHMTRKIGQSVNPLPHHSSFSRIG
jgi:predicted YcjX-like family ATPase